MGAPKRVLPEVWREPCVHCARAQANDIIHALLGDVRDCANGVVQCAWARPRMPGSDSRYLGVALEMLGKFGSALLHLSMLALVCAIGAYWSIRILTPAPAGMPPPPPAAAIREADPVLAARMFGLVQAAPVAQAALEVQALGAYAAGKDSAAVLAVGGKPARVYLLNQEVAAGAKLVEVRGDAVTIEQGGVRREIALPPAQVLGLGGKPPPPGYTREGGTLTAPSVAAGTQPTTAPPRPMQARPPAFQQPPAQPQAQPQAPSPQPPPQAVQPEEEEAPAAESAAGSGRRTARGRGLTQ